MIIFIQTKIILGATKLMEESKKLFLKVMIAVQELGRLSSHLNSLTGSSRYMMSNYQDAMTIYRYYSNPDLLITFTYNVNWPEIKREIKNKYIFHCNIRTLFSPEMIPSRQFLENQELIKQCLHNGLNKIEKMLKLRVFIIHNSLINMFRRLGKRNG